MHTRIRAVLVCVLVVSFSTKRASERANTNEQTSGPGGAKNGEKGGGGSFPLPPPCLAHSHVCSPARMVRNRLLCRLLIRGNKDFRHYMLMVPSTTENTGTSSAIGRRHLKKIPSTSRPRLHSVERFFLVSSCFSSRKNRIEQSGFDPCPGSLPCRLLVFLGKTLYSHSASPPWCTKMYRRN